MSLPERAVAHLAAVASELPQGEERAGQLEMSEAVARAIVDKRHLVVQAGTGTGKSLAYLVPAVLSGMKVIVATATKALQDQLHGKDLPFLHAHTDRPFTFEVLKGRSNYICLQRADEVEDSAGQQTLDVLADRASKQELTTLLEWSLETPTGDRADLPFEPSPEAWSAVSVSSVECPGAKRCPRGEDCFAEAARLAATVADLVVVNTHLYGIDLASDGVILPDHDVVILDEAHQLEDVISSTSGIEVSAGRFASLARVTRAILEDRTLIDSLEGAGIRLSEVLARDVDRRIRRLTDDELVAALDTGRRRAAGVIEALKAVPDDAPLDTKARKARATQAATHLVLDIEMIEAAGGPEVVWVEGPASRPTLKLAPLDVADVLRERLWGERTAVLTSATIPPRLAERLGLEPGDFEALDVGSPFDYETNAALYCAAALPEPRSPRYEEEMHSELRALIAAAGGRTLALFTSWRAMDAAAEALADDLPGTLLTQRDLPKPALIRAFQDEEASSLFATMGFWQGVDVPGPSLSLVTIDRLPFPRPDEPLLQARRELARQDAFGTVDLPRAATMLAQGAGRLIRTADDKGVVAVLDSRLATAGYRWELVRALPPMARTKDHAEVVAFLEGLHN